MRISGVITEALLIMPVTRRSMLILPAAGLIAPVFVPQSSSPPAASALTSPTFPAHDPALAREMVSVAHGNVARVRELLKGRPALAKATWDWGYGDWETALGAASHVGNREIAELLLGAGAAPTLFSAAMLGHLDTVKAFVAASPGIQQTKGPHGISLLAHARAGGARATEVVAYLEPLGNADPRYRNEPLTEAEQKGVLGRYTFGASTTDALTVAAGPRGLMIKREGAFERGLFHQGARVFHPAGAEMVRITFQGPAELATMLTVEDGPVVVAATRA